MSFDEDVMNYQPGATVQELVTFLQEFLNEHPEIADYEVRFPYECGWGSVSLPIPLNVRWRKTDKIPCTPNGMHIALLGTSDDADWNPMLYNCYEDRDLGGDSSDA